MNHYIIKASKPKDKFYLAEATEFVYFYCQGLTDLTKTIRCITPKGYRVRTNNWFSKYLKMNNNDLVLTSGLTCQVMFQIRKVDYLVKADKILDFTNGFGFSHKVKSISEKYWSKFDVDQN